MKDSAAPTNSRRPRAGLLAFFITLLLGDIAVALAISEGLPWPGVAGLGLAAGLGVLVSRRGSISRSDLLGWCCSSLLFLSGLLLWHSRPDVPAVSPAVWVGLFGATGLTASVRAREAAAKTRWRAVGLFWAFIGVAWLLGIAYGDNIKSAFCLGMLLGIALLTLCKSWYRLPGLLVQAFNTVNLLFVGALVLALVQGAPPPDRPGPPETKPYYRYSDAQQDPAGFRRWWGRYTGQWGRMLSALFEMHPGSPLFYRPRPGRQAMFCKSRVILNSLGFRGHELAQPKGDTYRIVALGESTTFGSTINPDDKPWPELLEQMIRERLKPPRPVEVVNAGIPSFGLTNNLLRLPTEILPLKPDVLISYHGYNGFNLLYNLASRKQALYPPVYRPRPVKLLGDCDYRLRVLWYRYQCNARLLAPASADAAMQTEYARAYRQLIAIARTNSIHLVLATYSMAVNQRSEPGVINFFRTGFPDAPISIKANEVHSLIVRHLCRENPDIIFVDTQPTLDGEHDLYLDLMHFTEEGDRRLAEAMFQALKPVLEHDLLAGPAS